MKSIQYPCETAAIFQDVVFVIRLRSQEELMSEINRAEDFFLSHFPYATIENLWDGVRYSFDGLYLNALQADREAM